MWSVFSLSISEETQVIVNTIYDDVWEAEDEKSGSFIDRVKSWDWTCF